MEQRQPKISITEAYFLIVFAILADLINWIPILNWAVTIITLPSYQLYFYIKRMRGIHSLIGNLIELIPVLSVLPGITTGIVIAIIIDRMESTKLGSKIIKPVEKIAGGAKPATGKMPAKTPALSPQLASTKSLAGVKSIS